MKPITYTNTITNVPGLAANMHLDYPFGYAYETPTHFIHFYGSSDFGVHVRLAVTEIRHGTLKDWVERVFGATDISEMIYEPGEAIEGIWRPSLLKPQDLYQALKVTDTERRLTNQAIRILLDRLEELFLFIEPDHTGLSAYSFKTRELLILACTEVENFWKQYMDKSNLVKINGKYSTNDYVKLADELLLKNYSFTIRTYASIPHITPFVGWDPINPTASLLWYDAYNKTKHDRNKYLSSATLLSCINAVVANLIMCCVRFGPSLLFDDLNAVSIIVNQHFIMDLVNPSREFFYLYKVDVPINIGTSLRYLDPEANSFILPFTTKSLIL